MTINTNAPISGPVADGKTASVAVDRFFRRVLADPTLAPFFEGAQLHRLAAQQHAFLTAALGSTFQWNLAQPVTAGPGTEAAMAEHLAAALRDAGFAQPAIDAVIAAVTRPTRPATPRGFLAAPEQLPQAPAPLPKVPGRDQVSA